MNEQDIKNRMFTGFFWRFGERMLAQIITFAVSLLLARLLSPDDYGVVALVMVFITIANVFVSNGLGTALVQKKTADDLDFSSMFYINIALGVLIYALIFFLAPVLASFYNMPVLSPCLRVLGLRIIVASINSIQQAYVSRNMLFKRFFVSTLFGTVLSGTVGVVLALNGFGVWALITQYLTNTTVDTIVLWFTVRWRPKLRFSITRTRQLLSFGWKLLVSSLIDTGYTQLRGLIIGKKYSSSDLAFYNQGEKYPGVIAVNTNTAIGSVIFPVMSQAQNDLVRLKKMTRKAIRISSYVLWPVMIGIAVVSEPLVKILLTEKWLPCIPYIRIFCISYAFWPVHTASLQAINALGRSDFFLKIEIVKKAIGLSAILLSMQFNPRIIAISVLITDVACTFINSFPNRILIEYNYKELFLDVIPAILLSLFMAIITIPISFFGLSSFLTFAIQILVGIAAYIMVSAVIRNDSFLYLKSLLIKR